MWLLTESPGLRGRGRGWHYSDRESLGVYLQHVGNLVSFLLCAQLAWREGSQKTVVTVLVVQGASLTTLHSRHTCSVVSLSSLVLSKQVIVP